MNREIVPVEDRTPDFGKGAKELIEQGNQLLMIRTKTQMMTALQRPRDENVFRDKLCAMASQAGEDFFYSIPFKNHVQGCQDRRKCECPAERAEGPGVGLARAAAPIWGNCTVETGPVVDRETETAWLLEALWIDFENNFTRTERRVWSKVITRKGGRKVVPSDPRELDLVFAQGIARVERDCILKALPHHIVEDAVALAMQADRQSKKPLPEQVARILRKFHDLGVSPAQLAAYIGAPEFSIKGMTEVALNVGDVCSRLRGLASAITTGIQTVEDVFGVPQGTAGVAIVPQGEVRVEDVIHPQPETKAPAPEPTTPADEMISAEAETNDPNPELKAAGIGKKKQSAFDF